MILTRYLYQKHNVEYSLYISLFQKDAEQAKFWAYELFYSGYKKQTVHLLLEIYRDYYMDELCKPKIMAFLEKKIGEWTLDNTKESIVGTMIENIVRREPDFCKIYDKWKIMENEKNLQQQKIRCNTDKKILYVVLKEDSVRKYKTKPLVLSKGWMLPPKVCLYSSYREPGSLKIDIHDYADFWLYFASECPLWKTRIQKYGGIVDHKKRQVQFIHEEHEEKFNNLYDMEPDEQPLEVQKKWFGQGFE